MMNHNKESIAGISDTPTALAGGHVDRLARLVGLVSALLLLAVASGLV